MYSVSSYPHNPTSYLCVLRGIRPAPPPPWRLRTEGPCLQHFLVLLSSGAKGRLLPDASEEVPSALQHVCMPLISCNVRSVVASNPATSSRLRPICTLQAT
jgi:hypothetical protein